MDDALVEGDAGTERENQQRDDEAPEIELAPMPERMFLVGRPCGSMQAIEQQSAITRIDQRMHAFRQHRRTAGEERSNKFRDRDGEVARQRGIDDGLRSRMGGHRASPFDCASTTHYRSDGPRKQGSSVRPATSMKRAPSPT